MDTKRRSVEIKIWDYRFYSDLDPNEKLFYWFITCHCDNAGVYVHNPSLVNYHCGIEIDFQKFIDKVNTRNNIIEVLNDETIWIKDFIRITWKTITGNNNLGLSCYTLLVQHGILDKFIRSFPNNINIPSYIDSILKGKKGYAGLPLPQASVYTDPEMSKRTMIEGQVSTILGGITNTNTNTNNNNSNYNSTSAILNALLKTMPKKAVDYPDHVLLADLERVIGGSLTSNMTATKEYVLNLSIDFKWQEKSWDDFIELLENEFKLTKVNNP